MVSKDQGIGGAILAVCVIVIIGFLDSQLIIQDLFSS